MNAMAERSLTTPNTPVKKRDDETEVKPADMNITGASEILTLATSPPGYQFKLTIIQSI